MHLATTDSNICLERVGRARLSPRWSVRIAIANQGYIVALHGLTRVQTSAETLAQVARFTARRSRSLELTLANGGWLCMQRDREGTVVRYRLGPLVGNVILEGEMLLKGEAAEACYRGLPRLVGAR